jgi:hypothetical protein
VDDITYEPLVNVSSSTSSPGQAVMLDSTDVDGGFVSQNGWKVDSDSGFVSETAGAEMTIKFYGMYHSFFLLILSPSFHLSLFLFLSSLFQYLQPYSTYHVLLGTSITMYGLHTTGKTASMMYIIDGSSPASMPILVKRQSQSQSQSPAAVASANSNTFATNTSANTKIIPNQILFQSPTFSPGPHTFSFNVTSASTSSPFRVSYFIIGTPSLSDTLSFNPSAMSSSPASSSGSVMPSSTMGGAIATGIPISTLEHSSQSMVGKVAGGVIGALVIVALLGGVLGWMRWKKKGIFASQNGRKEYALREGTPRAYYVSPHGGSYGQQTHTKNSSGETTGTVIDSPVMDKEDGMGMGMGAMGVVVNVNDTNTDKEVIAFPTMDYHAPAPPPIPVLLSSSSPSLSPSQTSAAGSAHDMSASASASATAVGSTFSSGAVTAKRQSSYGSSMTKEERRRSMSMRKAPPQLTDEEEVPPLPVPSIPASTGATPNPSPRASVVHLPAVGAAGGHAGKLGMLTTPGGSPVILMPDLPLDQQSLSRVSTPSHGR